MLRFHSTHRGPLRCCQSSKLVGNYKHTQGHSWAEPASHRAHLIQSETQQLPPSVCLCVWLQLFHYLFEQIGLQLVCGGLIVTRDERLRRARVCRGPGFCWATLLCQAHRWYPVLVSETPPLFLDSEALLRWRIFHLALLHSLHWLMGKCAGWLENTTSGKIYVYRAIKSACLSHPLKHSTHLWQSIYIWGNESFFRCS